MNRPGSILLTVLVAWAAAGVARADQLVTRDGTVIETRGPWEVRGKLLVFKLADGTLASLRLDEADLEASEELARAAERRALRAREESMQPAPSPPQAVLVLTDKDVSHIDESEQPEPEGVEEPAAAAAAGTAGEPAAGGDGGEADATAGAEPAAVAGSGRGVQVVQWSQEDGGDTGVLVNGVIQNLGSSLATSVSVNALFYDETGNLLAARDVPLDSGALRPGERRQFSVSLPHTLVFDEIKFQVVGRGFRSVGQSVRTRAAEAAEPESELP